MRETGLLAVILAGLIGPMPSVRSGEAGRTGALEVETVGPASVALGEPLRYTIVVRNPTAVAVRGVTLEDRLSRDAEFLSAEPAAEVREDRLLWSFASLEANSERRIQVVLKPGREGPLESRATVTCSATSALATMVVRPKLAVQLSYPERVPVGDPAVVSIQVQNDSPGPYRDVTIRSRLPAGLRHPQGGHIEAVLGTLAAGETKSVTLRVLAAQAGRHAVTIDALSKEVLRSRAEGTILVGDGPRLPEPAPARPKRTTDALEVEVADRDDPVRVGGETFYQVRVRNPGTSAVEGVRVSASIPRGMELDQVGGPTGFHTEGNVIRFDAQERLAPGEEASYVVGVRARQPGDWRFDVEVAVGKGSGTIRRDQSTRVVKP